MYEEYIHNKYDHCSESNLRSKMMKDDKDSDEAAFYLIRYRMYPIFKNIYERYHMPDEIGDVLQDFWLYLRNGKTGNNTVPYQGMKGIRCAFTTSSWLRRTFSNFLVDRNACYQRQKDVDVEYQKESCDRAESRDDQIRILSFLVAWLIQESTPDERFMLYRHLMHSMCREELIENQRMADAMGIQYGNYRTRDSRLGDKIQRFLDRLQKREIPKLDEEYSKLSTEIYENFGNMKDLLKDQYELNLPDTSHWQAIVALRKADLEERKAAAELAASASTCTSRSSSAQPGMRYSLKQAYADTHGSSIRGRSPFNDGFLMEPDPQPIVRKPTQKIIDVPKEPLKPNFMDFRPRRWAFLRFLGGAMEEQEYKKFLEITEKKKVFQEINSKSL